MENEWPVSRLIPLAVALRQRNEIELIANAQGMSLMEIESETKLEEMSDQVLEAVFDSKSLHSQHTLYIVILWVVLFFSLFLLFNHVEEGRAEVGRLESQC